MFGRKKRDVVDVERLRRVVNLIPEYVDALIDERRTRTAAVNGLDARETHGPAERKLKKVEVRLAELLGRNLKLETGNLNSREKAQKGQTGAEQRKVFYKGWKDKEEDAAE